MRYSLTHTPATVVVAKHSKQVHYWWLSSLAYTAKTGVHQSISSRAPIEQTGSYLSHKQSFSSQS